MIAVIRSNDANVAVTFGLALIPIVMAIGMAVDLAFVETAKSHLQQAVDVAALSALADNTSESKRAAAARFAFDANLPEEIRGLSPSFDVEISGASTSPIAATRSRRRFHWRLAACSA